MRTLTSSTLALLLALPGLSPAGWKDMQGKPLEDTEWMKSHGDFGAQLLLITDEQAFFKRWETPSKVVSFDTASIVHRGQPLITPIIFSGCTADAQGHCQVSADFKILRPDGTAYAELPQVGLWQNRPPPPPGLLELGVGYIKVVIEPEDPAGTYTVEAQVKDAVGHAAFVLTQRFTVPDESTADTTPPPPEADTAAQERLGRWLTYYYLSPPSAQDLAQIKAMFAAGFFDKPTAVTPLIMFLAEVFRQNTDRLPGWETELRTIARHHHPTLFQALWETDTPEAKALMQHWPDTVAADKKAQIQATPPIDLKTLAITSPQHLDMLWATFMASGDTGYVDRIIDVLATPTDADDKATRINNTLLVGAAKWSLGSNAEQHERVLKACQARADDPNAAIRAAVTEIIEESKARSGAPQESRERAAAPGQE